MSELRQACDRCHGKKLRCPKLSGSRICTRCAKAGAPCVFSPPVRSTPARISRGDVYSEAYYTTQQGFGDFSGNDPEPLNWPEPTCLDHASDISLLQLPLPPPPTPLTRKDDEQASAAEFAMGSPSPTDVASGLTSQDDSQEGCLTIQLSGMIATLDGLLGKLSGLEVLHMSTQQAQGWIALVSSKLDLKKAMEQVLQCTQRLVALYLAVLEHVAREAEPKEDCAISDCIHHAVDEKTLLPRVDTTLLQLLLACHSRQLDVCTAIVKHGLLCSHICADIPPEERRLDVPEIRIGTFVAPRLAAASLLLFMMIELLIDVEHRSKDLTEFFTRALCSNARDQESKQMKALSLQSEINTDRTTQMIEQMRYFKDSMATYGGVG